MNKLDEQEYRQAWRVLHEAGSQAEAARRLGIARSTLQNRLRRAIEELGEEVTRPHVRGSVKKMATRVLDLPPKGQVYRCILTSAQNNTLVHPQVWENILALAEYYNADIMVSRFTYNKASYGEKSVKPGKAANPDDTDDLWYAPELADYICDERVEVAPALVFCGELQIEPTARRPLQGFESYTGRKSSIIPHTTISLESVASGKHEATKFLYSTGTVTQMNYIQKRAGLKAEHHHCFGALLVEVDDAGRWFVRQLEAGDKGEIYDLGNLARNGKVTGGHRVEAVTWGDIHAERGDPVVAEICWGEGGMLDTLRPREQHAHDPLDFSRRSHHDRRNPFRRLELLARGEESVAGELVNTGTVLRNLGRPWCNTLVVKSNHCRHLEKWLMDSDWREDLVNAELMLSLQLAKVRAITNGNDIDITEVALKSAGHCPDNVSFLGEDESHVICKEHDGGIECGMHGDLGPNGSRASPRALTKMGRRANIGHTHSAQISDGVYVAGTCSLLDMKYNKGPSSWSQSHIVTYPNSRRTIVTVWGGKWRA